MEQQQIEGKGHYNVNCIENSKAIIFSFADSDQGTSLNPASLLPQRISPDHCAIPIAVK